MVNIYSCDRCLKRFWVEEEYKKHMEKREKKKCKIIKCFRCGKKFRKRLYLDNHEEFFCYITYEECKICNKKINSKKMLDHLETCKKEKKSYSYNHYSYNYNPPKSYSMYSYHNSYYSGYGGYVPSNYRGGGGGGP